MSSNAKAVLLVAIAFVGGLFIGVSGDRLYLIRTHQFFPRRPTSFAAQRLVGRLDHELNLSETQRVAIQRIVSGHHARIETIWNDARPRVRTEIEAANGEIEKVLTPEQRTKFRNLRMHEAPHRGRGSRPF